MKNIIKKAKKLATKAHEGVTRKYSNKPYITHPKAVFQILKRLTKDKNILAAAWLHDVIEDTDYSYNDLKKEFGKKIADIVQEVTKNKKTGEFKIRTKEALMVKLADMLHNISDSEDKAYIKKKINYLNGKGITMKRTFDDVMELSGDLNYQEKMKKPRRNKKSKNGKIIKLSPEEAEKLYEYTGYV